MQHLYSIFVSTYAVLFLGTPHNGSSKVALASIGRRMVSALMPSKMVDTDGQLLDALREGSETLQNITDMFVPLMKNFRIYFFWEQEKTDFGTKKDYASLLDLTDPRTELTACRSLRRVLRPRSWTTRSALVCPTTTPACASLRAAARRATGSSRQR